MAAKSCYVKILQLCLCFSLIFHTLRSLATPSTVVHGDNNTNNNLSTKLQIGLASPLFVFGDSLYDPGNNNYIDTPPQFRANFLPYGESHFEFATGRFSNGRIIPDFIAKFAKLPLIPPYFQSGYRQFSYGVNFASGGAGALVETFQGKAISLKGQLMHFKDVEKQLRKRVGDKETQELLSNAVYMFDIGVNDILNPDPRYTNFSTQEYIDIIVGNFTDVVKEVYKVGGMKFWLVNLLPLGCTPYARAGNNGGGEICEEGLTGLVNQYNEALSRGFKQLEKQLQGFIYSEFDLCTVVKQRILNPSKYGFKEVKSACCGSGMYRGNYSCGGKREEAEYEVCDNPEDHFFWDCHHPSEKAYQQIAQLMWSGPPTITAQYNLKSLFQLRIRNDSDSDSDSDSDLDLDLDLDSDSDSGSNSNWNAL